MRMILASDGSCICSVNDQCAGCARHLELADYAGQELIVPQWGYRDGISFCADRRSAAQPLPAAVCESESGAVYAHAHTVGDGRECRSPANVGSVRTDSTTKGDAA